MVVIVIVHNISSGSRLRHQVLALAVAVHYKQTRIPPPYLPYEEGPGAATCAPAAPVLGGSRCFLQLGPNGVYTNQAWHGGGSGEAYRCNFRGGGGGGDQHGLALCRGQNKAFF
jgi:hypothetical protein